MRSAVPIVVVLWCATSCAAPQVGVGAGYLDVGVRGTVGLESSGDGLQPIDVEDELGLGRSGAPFAEASLDGDLGRLQVSGFRYESSGTGSLDQSFGAIAAGTVVESDLTFDNVKVGWTYDVLDTGAVRIGPGLGVDWFGIDTRVRSVTTVSAYERIDVQAPVPMLLLRGDATFGPVRLDLAVGGMVLDVGDLDGSFLDFEGRLTVVPVDGVELFAAYRRIDLDAEGTSDGQGYDADLVVDGWVLGAGVRF